MICNEPARGYFPRYTASFSGDNPTIFVGVSGGNQAKLAV